MAKSGSSQKSWPVALGGLAVVLIAGYFSLDLGGSGSGDVSGAETGSGGAGSSETAVSAENDTCELSSLSEEAAETVETIQAGGPYPHPDNDNQRFGNYEGVLPDQASDYYREYTVETPGLNHRGERRIVTGGGSETDPEHWYYTSDHYESFCEIPDAEH
ncbi:MULTISPECIES: ribonuclease domain-containing protein [unclassified Corynebacterium]|uniref:ribonuclease domain-containing protein n=1 Tax=unclassified Corynebacterium TaxID=2624378 RepID=UPI0034CDAF28